MTRGNKCTNINFQTYQQVKNSTTTILYRDLSSLDMKHSNTTSRVQTVDPQMPQGPQLVHEYTQP